MGADISSLNLFSSQSNPRSLRMRGMINEREFLVLIYGGSTHNFIKPAAAAMKQLAIEKIPQFHVYTGNVDTLLCSGI